MKRVELDEYEELSDTHKSSGEQYVLDDSSDSDINHQISDDDSDENLSLQNSERQNIQDDHYRLLNNYFKDISCEPLLDIREEIEIPAKIKKCETKARQIKSLIRDISEESKHLEDKNAHFSRQKDDLWCFPSSSRSKNFHFWQILRLG